MDKPSCDDVRGFSQYEIDENRRKTKRLQIFRSHHHRTNFQRKKTKPLDSFMTACDERIFMLEFSFEYNVSMEFVHVLNGNIFAAQKKRNLTEKVKNNNLIEFSVFYYNKKSRSIY